MPKESDAAPRSKIADLLAWMGVLLVWALFLLAMAFWEMAGWFQGYAGRRRRRRWLFLLPLVAFSLAAWKVGPVFWARFVLLDQAAFAARRSEGLETSQVEAKLRAEALRLGLTDIQRQEGAIEVEMAEEEGSRRCRVRFEFTQEVRLLRWTCSVPIRGAVDEAILPKPARPWSEETLVH
ncbi:MAG: hypothetical protein KGN80_10565 [Acidobacteriota bacterium]|nr:hypothetical protein [Acidobacteriota bacterium]